MEQPKPSIFPFSGEDTPFFVEAGRNKGGWKVCPFCKAAGVYISAAGMGAFKGFRFRDQLSAIEYTISGLCQACQDGVFTE